MPGERSAPSDPGMANLFFDTSALVKRYHDEAGTERVDELIEHPDASVIASSLAVIEAVSAFRRKCNLGDIDESEMLALVGAFFREALEEFAVLPIEESVVGFSFDLVLEDDLRTLDSLQLSSGLSVSEEIGDVTFVTADDRLATVADDRGLDVETPW